MVAKQNKNKHPIQHKNNKHEPETHAATTLIRVVCLLAVIGILVLDALIPTFDYPVWVLGLLMGVVIGLGPQDLKDWFRGKR